ncbi:MAG: hypothetical protein ACD_79C00396G0002 [uncultured bacterium]|nr:MAG: hypothetical protein ACD_79C00396G0002 [uncultured bacterium]
MSYQRIKKFIFANLQNNSGPLDYNKISKEIETTKELIETIGLNLFAQILPDKSVLNNLTNDEWDLMKRELETHFDVKMEKGVLIQGEEQQERDSTWWTRKEKQNNEKYYWERYKKYIGKFLPPTVLKTIDEDTDIVMDNIENPLTESFSRYGMVVGHVQSGKTANYSALICKAVDSGYKFIVVIAGGLNNLRNQTQERLNESFIGQDRGNQIGAGVGDTHKDKLPISLTTKKNDFNKRDADKNSQSLNLDNNIAPMLLVIKKNIKTLNNVIEWLENHYKNKIPNHAMLLIDDESDYGSINTNKKNEEPTAINKQIRKLLNLFSKGSYVAYTATPYANIFIDHEANHADFGSDLFPKDFIYALEAPSNYFSAKKVFLDTNDEHLKIIDDYQSHIPLDHKKDILLSSLPDSLFEAIRLFIINVAIRNINGEKNKHNSMLINVTRFTNVHKQIAIHVENYLSEIIKQINVYGKLKKAIIQSDIIKQIKETFDNKYKNLKITWQEVVNMICKTVKTIMVREVHQASKIPLIYGNDIVTNAIVIGGNSLSRGFTLEGLNVSYFLRNTIFYDTLMQMGRWFGYRVGYENLCQIYIPKIIIDNFSNIIDATDDLIKDLKIMSENNMTPNDFGLSIKIHPDSALQVVARKLQVTAKNKQQNAHELIIDMKLDGHSKETSWLSDNEEDKKKNLMAIVSLITNLSKFKSKDLGSVLWENVPKNLAEDFLKQFKIYKKDPLGITARMPIDFVKKYVKDKDTTWDVALYSGDGLKYPIINNIIINTELRKIVEMEGYYEIKNRQVSSGNAESITFSPDIRKKIGSDRKKARALLKRPLLMLHIIEVEKKDGEKENLAAFGISFPGSALSSKETVKIIINSVYYKNYLKEYDEAADD